MERGVQAGESPQLASFPAPHSVTSRGSRISRGGCFRCGTGKHHKPGLSFSELVVTCWVPQMSGFLLVTFGLSGSF